MKEAKPVCAVSGLHDYFRQNVPLDNWTRPVFNEYQEIIRRLDKLDAHFAQPACEEPAKAMWLKDVEARLAKLEA